MRNKEEFRGNPPGTMFIAAYSQNDGILYLQYELVAGHKHESEACQLPLESFPEESNTTKYATITELK